MGWGCHMRRGRTGWDGRRQRAARDRDRELYGVYVSLLLLYGRRAGRIESLILFTRRRKYDFLRGKEDEGGKEERREYHSPLLIVVEDELVG